jgi:hypothetical protein
VRGKKSRLAAVVAAAGACAMLAACSPVKIGSAAIVGNDRITGSSLSTQVSNLQSDLQPYRVTATPQQLSSLVLGWLIKFQIQDKVATNAGVSVDESDVQNALSLLYKNERAAAAQQGASVPRSITVIYQGVPNSLSNELGTYYAQFLGFEKQANGGTLPSAAEQFTPDQAYYKASCQAQQSLNIQVNPQYGQLDYGTNTPGFFYGVVPSNDVLSRPTGKASPAVTPSFPAC